VGGGDCNLLPGTGENLKKKKEGKKRGWNPSVLY
jgi:hypothetical protein